MQSLGTTTDISYMIPMEAVTTLSFSDETLSTEYFQLGLRVGERFAKKNGKDVELYQAEALYLLTEICKDETKRYLGKAEETRIPITDENLLTRQVYRGLYEYMYADRVVCASRSTVWRNEQEDKQVVTTSSFTRERYTQSGDRLSNDVIDKRPTETDLLEAFEEVARSSHEREFLYLKLQGAEESEIAQSLNVCERVVNDIRARIVKRLRKKQRGENGRVSVEDDDSGEQPPTREERAVQSSTDASDPVAT